MRTQLHIDEGARTVTVFMNKEDLLGTLDPVAVVRYNESGPTSVCQYGSSMLSVCLPTSPDAAADNCKAVLAGLERARQLADGCRNAGRRSRP